MKEENFEVEILEPSEDEQKAWEVYLQTVNPESLDIPFSFSVGAVTLSGVIHIATRIERTRVVGVVVGVINGNFRLDRNELEAKLYPPIRLQRLVIELNIQRRRIRARIDTRNFSGTWNKGDWESYRF